MVEKTRFQTRQPKYNDRLVEWGDSEYNLDNPKHRQGLVDELVHVGVLEQANRAIPSMGETLVYRLKRDWQNRTENGTDLAGVYPSVLGMHPLRFWLRHAPTCALWGTEHEKSFPISPNCTCGLFVALKQTKEVGFATQRSEDYPKNDEESRRIRGERGWCPSDVWSMDTYISDVIAGMLRQIVADNVGYPSDLTPESWDAILIEMAEGFEGWAAHFECDSMEEEQKAYERVRKSIKMMRRHFGSLWT